MHDSTLKALRSLAFAALLALPTATSAPAAEKAPAPGAEVQAVPVTEQVPVREQQIILIKATLLTFNDANLTGNYTVLHARLSKRFRDQVTPERLAEIFKVFNDQQINIRSIITKRHTSTVPPRIDGGVLKLKGYFEEGRNRLHYGLDFVLEDREWKPLRIEVYIKPIPPEGLKTDPKAAPAKKKKKGR